MGAYATLYGSTVFATAGVASTSLTGIGTAVAAAAGGFAAGGINGGNIQSALRGAFTAALTVGVLQGLDALAGGAGSTADSSMGASTAADTTSGTYSGTAGATATDASMGGVTTVEGSWSTTINNQPYLGTSTVTDGVLNMSWTRTGTAAAAGALQQGGMGAVLGDLVGINFFAASFGVGGLFAATAATAPRLAGSTMLYRRGAYDAVGALRTQAAAAEQAANVGVHGVSVSLSSAGRYAGQVVRCATCAEFENAGFQIVKTATDPNHFTAVLPKTISPEIARLWNSLLTIRP